MDVGKELIIQLNNNMTEKKEKRGGLVASILVGQMLQLQQHFVLNI